MTLWEISMWAHRDFKFKNQLEKLPKDKKKKRKKENPKGVGQIIKMYIKKVDF